MESWFGEDMKTLGQLQVWTRGFQFPGQIGRKCWGNGARLSECNWDLTIWQLWVYRQTTYLSYRIHIGDILSVLSLVASFQSGNVWEYLDSSQCIAGIKQVSTFLSPPCVSFSQRLVQYLLGFCIILHNSISNSQSWSIWHLSTRQTFYRYFNVRLRGGMPKPSIPIAPSKECHLIPTWHSPDHRGWGEHRHQ